MKIEDKLGFGSRYTTSSGAIKGLNDADFEKFGVMKYSHYQDYGSAKELDLTCQRYEKYY